MKNILLIGVGGTGSEAVDILYQKIQELGSQNDNNISAIVFDTDVGSVQQIKSATTISMADNASVGTICDRLGTDHLREWFPCDNKAVRNQEMIRGASQWRKKSYLAFLNLMNKPMARSAFIGALEKMVADPSASCEVYVITSVAGGTGSGSFIPIALYTRRYLRKNLGKDPIVNAMIALPDIFAGSQTPENRVKVYANAYAILRELNAINLVARNYNEGRTTRKKSPVRFRIGSPDEPNVGVLFDASDRKYWTPEAAPFTKIFVLDKIPGVKSVAAHNIVLANSLYSLICTDIGVEFDSEESNHEILRSQNNGSNAIFAGISTSQVRFPKNSILEYLSYQKTLKACEDEWLVLHNAVERKIQEKDKEEKELGRRYILKDGDYAKLMLEALDLQEQMGATSIIDLVDRGTAIYDKEGKKTGKSTADEYFSELDQSLENYIPDWEKTFEGCTGENVSKARGDDALETLASNVNGYYEGLLKHYSDCVQTIKRLSSTVCDRILGFDKKKFSTSKNVELMKALPIEFSLVKTVLQKNGKYIHPVAAIVQLCRLKSKIVNAGLISDDEMWADFKARSIEAVPEDLLTFASPTSKCTDANYKKSYYAKQEAGRFIKILDMANDLDEYQKQRFDARHENEFIKFDVKELFEKISNQALDQFKALVFKRLSEDIDLLIEKYRSFLTRFDKEKEDLIEETKTVKRKDCGLVDSVINVFSDEESKDAIMNTVFKEAGPETDADIAETDNIVGLGVLETVYNSSVSAKYSTAFNEKDSKAYRSLFNNMIKSYRDSIAKSDVFDAIAQYNVIEAIEASCGDKNDENKRKEAFRKYFSAAQEIATPSLKIDTRSEVSDLVAPSNIMVFMMSKETGKYIKKNADVYGLRLPADQTKESSVIKSCAEEFIRKYSGYESARVTLVDQLPSEVLYCTGEVMDITPLRIPKFNEIGEDNIYFRNYVTSIENSKIYDTDMWNPHIGFGLNKRGFLPFMNEEMEKICDKKMIKALIYGLAKGKIIYSNGSGKSASTYCFRYVSNNGVENYIKVKVGDSEVIVHMKNVAHLVSWIRNEDDLIDEWSARFDEEIEVEKNSLPNIASENEIRKLEASLTNKDFMKWLRLSLFKDSSKSYNDKNIFEDETTEKGEEDVKPDRSEDRVGPSIIEFAYLVKTSEETYRDNDDAERILEVAYDTFMELCSYRVNPDLSMQWFIQVYKQQLDNMFLGLLNSKMIRDSKRDCESYFNQFLSWMYFANTFRDISIEFPMDENGKVSINKFFDYKEADRVAIRNALSKIKKL